MISIWHQITSSLLTLLYLIIFSAFYGYYQHKASISDTCPYNKTIIGISANIIWILTSIFTIFTIITSYYYKSYNDPNYKHYWKTMYMYVFCIMSSLILYIVTFILSIVTIVNYKCLYEVSITLICEVCFYPIFVSIYILINLLYNRCRRRVIPLVIDPIPPTIVSNSMTTHLI